MYKITFYKTSSYAIMHMGIAILVAYILSGSWALALAIGLIEPIAQTIAYFFHERIWHRIERKKGIAATPSPSNVKNNCRDHHDSLIDSVTPIGYWIERLLHRKKKTSEKNK